MGWLSAPSDVSDDDDDPLEDWLSERLASDDVAMILRDSDLACTGSRRGAGLLFFSIVRGKLLVIASCSWSDALTGDGGTVSNGPRQLELERRADRTGGGPRDGASADRLREDIKGNPKEV